MKKLSILIPVFNSEDYLDECMLHMRKAGVTDAQNIEIIFVNDGSTDGSRKSCDFFAATYSNVNVIHKKNEGVSVARNTAMDKATGDSIMFLDADDYLMEENWNLVKTYLESEQTCDFIAFSYQTLYSDGRVEEEPFPITDQITESLQTARKLTYASSKMNTCWGKIFRRALIEEKKIRFIPGMKTGEDAMFVMEYMKYCQTVQIVNQPILRYRQVAESAMHSLNIKRKYEDFKRMADYRKKVILPQDVLFDDMNREHFSVITNLMLQMAREKNTESLSLRYKKLLQQSIVQEILRDVKKKTLSPVYKLVEYSLMKHHCVHVLTFYFKLKAGK